ncbi:hypothetical protein FO519_004930 [Halicephalobus sp. NKZ332]|nr:hypothetical protein FO519_004930 [Halicephalobus sp. NKZ332]
MISGFLKITASSPFDYEEAKKYSASVYWPSFWISMAYVVVIFSVKYLMKERKPLELRLGLQLWNLWLALFSIAGALVTTVSLFSDIQKNGLSASYCHNGDFFRGTSGLWSFLFCMSKIAELGDTMFIVLRKRPLMFLHWYHHVATLNYGMLTYADGTAYNSWIIWLNFSVHAIMYSYYFLAACKIRAPAAIAQCITFLQIAQFIITHLVLFHVGYLVLTGTHCDMHFGTYLYCLLMEISYVYLFGKFFYESYIKSAASEEQTTVIPKIPQKDLHDYCADFLDCESEMMNVHQLCTEKSRKATAAACGIEKDFLKLNELMEVRINEFSLCVSNETDEIENDFDRFERLEIPFGTCVPLKSEEMHKTMESEGCWKAVALVKQRCQILQKCCPAAEICTKKGRNSEATKNVRVKHIEINRKTLECRSKMQKILEQKKLESHADNNDNNLIAKAHAVLTSQGNSGVDAIQKKYVFNKKESHQLILLKGNQNIIPLNKPVTTTVLPPTSALKVHGKPELAPELTNSNTQKVKEQAVTPGPIHSTTHKASEQVTLRPIHSTIQETPQKTVLSNRQNLKINQSEVIQRLIYNNNRKLKVTRPFGRHSVISGPAKNNIRTTNQKMKVNFDEPERVTLEAPESPTTTTVKPRGSKGRYFNEAGTRSAQGSLNNQGTQGILRAPGTSKKAPTVEEIRLRQAKEFKELIRSLELEARTTTFAPNVEGQRRFLGNSLRKPIGIFNTNFHQRGIVPKLTGLHQSKSFALPQNFNLRKTNIFEARPGFREKAFKKPTFDPVKTNPLGKQILPESPRSGSERAKAHSIKIQTNEKPINIFPEKLKFESEAFVDENGSWTMRPKTEKDYPDYDATVTPEVKEEMKMDRENQEKLRMINIENDKEDKQNKELTRTTVGKELRGYRNKLLATWRTTPPALMVIFNSNSGQLSPFQDTLKEDSSEIELTFRRTMMPFPTTSVVILTTPPTTTSTTNPPTTSTIPPTTTSTTSIQSAISSPAQLTSEQEAEIVLVKSELMRNLEEYLKRNEKEVKKRLSEEKQKKRLIELRTSKKEYLDKDREMSYCHLYSICSEELKFIQKSCKAVEGRLIPGLPRRRFGECNRKLVAEYKNIEKLKKKSEKEFETCLAFKILESPSPTSLDICPAEWPLLSQFDVSYTCSQKTRIVQNHCSKLARCCSAVQECREELEESETAMILTEKEEEAAKASATCQIKAYNDYKKFRTRHNGFMRVSTVMPGAPEPSVTVAPTLSGLPATVTPSKGYQTPELVFPTLMPFTSLKYREEKPQVSETQYSLLRRIEDSGFSSQEEFSNDKLYPLTGPNNDESSSTANMHDGESSPQPSNNMGFSFFKITDSPKLSPLRRISTSSLNLLWAA